MVPKANGRKFRDFISANLANGIKLLTLAIVLAVASQAGSATQKQPQPQQNWNWDAYGGHSSDSHYVPLTQIDKSNVNHLKVAWVYPTQDQNSYVFNPIEVDGVLYVLARNDSLVALNASTGKVIWVQAGLAGVAPRGIDYWQSQNGKDRRLIFEIHNQLQEINAETGKSILTFGDNGYVDLRAGLGRPVNQVYQIQSGTPGEVYKNLIITGSSTGEQYLAPPGDIRAYNVVTGKKVWQFHVIPHPGQVGYDTWPKGEWKYVGAADAWAGLSIDRQHGIVYIPTGGPKYELYGGDRPGENFWSDSLIALNALTGKLVWGFQAVHHDVWDYDMCSAPQLVTIEHDGKQVDAVAAAGKTGFLYVFNRLTGKPIWPIVERPVPQSHVPGERTWPTQPYPTAPPPFSKQMFTAADINPYLPMAAQKKLADTIANDLNGPIFTPPERQQTIETPGNRGGSNWGTTAADPDTGMVYVLSINAPALLQESTHSPFAGRRPVNTAGETPGHIAYQQHCAVCHGASREGSGSIPSLVGITSRLGPEAIGNQIRNGGGQMPPFAGLSNAEISEIISYLANPSTGGAAGGPGRGLPRGSAATSAPVKLGGKVVAWGGSPAGRAANPHTSTASNPYGIMQGPPYPKGFPNPITHRYFTGWNVHYNIMGPPWNTLTAYDLNTGTIKWQVSVGTSPGILTEQRGAIVTASGLVFLATGDGKVRAYDAKTGKILWTGDLPAGSRGIPAIYQWDGREYLVVSATWPVQKPAVMPARGFPGPAATGARGEKIERAYIAFALPEGHSD